MIEIICKDTLYTYNAYHITKAFFPEEKICQRVDEEQEPLVMLTGKGGSCFSIALSLKEKEDKEAAGSESGNRIICETKDRQEKKRQVTRLLYQSLSKETGKSLAWGMLTGVRPTKLVMQKLEGHISDKEIIQFLKEEYFVSDKKADLSVRIAGREKKLLEKLRPGGFSLYVGIPFCPSVCSYCSFSSSPVALWKERMDDYLDALCKEIRALGTLPKGRQPDTVYIGGGTPTSLSAGQLERLLATIETTFSLENVLEYTVEAGRPDSITREKLEVIRRHPVTRISVNPQTMQQKTLDLVGRRHTVQDVKDIFHMAREMGFDNINMDLIAGLPGETAEDMADTLKQIEMLRPDSLTVHSLAIKRAAKMGQEARKSHSAGYTVSEDKVQTDEANQNDSLYGQISKMVEDSAASAMRMELLPYYLYRQKNIAGNFENVGYAKVDKAGIYNILIMEEKQTILAAGAGAGTKIVLPEKIRLDNGKETNLIRIENVKNIEEYIGRIDEITENKSARIAELLQ